MRTRNIKINVFLNEDEKKLLMDKSKKAKLSQSDFIRNLIIGYYSYQLKESDAENFNAVLLRIVENLSILKHQMDFLRYSDYSNFISKQIEELDKLLNKFH